MEKNKVETKIIKIKRHFKYLKFMTKSMKMSEETEKPETCEALERVSAHTQEQLQLYKT